jgi:predicted transcriptional regulator
LKALFNKALTGSELNQQTGLVGGQLYHHLGILEEAKLIAKEREIYTLTLKGAKVLLMLVTLASDVWVQTVAEQ